METTSLIKPVILTIIGRHTINDEPEIIFKKRVLLDKIMTDSKENVGFNISIRVPEVLGKYSSVEIGIQLTAPGDIENFETHIDKYLDRALTYEREAINQIAVAFGNTPIFEEVKDE